MPPDAAHLRRSRTAHPFATVAHAVLRLRGLRFLLIVKRQLSVVAGMHGAEAPVS